MKFIELIKLIVTIALVILPITICLFLLNSEFVKEPPQKVNCYDSKASVIIGQECFSQDYNWPFVVFLTYSVLHTWTGTILVVTNELYK